MEFKNYLLSISFALIIIVFSTIHYSFPDLVKLFADFPTHPDIRLASIDGVEGPLIMQLLRVMLFLVPSHME